MCCCIGIPQIFSFLNRMVRFPFLMRLMWLCHSVPLKNFFSLHWSLLNAGLWWKTEVVPQPFRIRYRSALWLRSNFLNPSEFPPCILTCSKKFLPWGWAICWAISWDVRGIWSIAPTKCRSLSERPPDLSVPQCVTLSVWERRNNFLTQSAEVTNAKVTNANAH